MPKLGLLVVGAILIFIAGLFRMVGAGIFAWSLPAEGETPSLSESYNPAYFGLPQTVAGYKVLAVLTSDNTACMSPGSRKLVLQAAHSLAAQGDEVLSTTAGDAAVAAELRKRGLADFAREGWVRVGPELTFDEFVMQAQDWNAHRREHGCEPPASASPTPR